MTGKPRGRNWSREDVDRLTASWRFEVAPRTTAARHGDVDPRATRWAIGIDAATSEEAQMIQRLAALASKYAWWPNSGREALALSWAGDAAKRGRVLPTKLTHALRIADRLHGRGKAPVRLVAALSAFYRLVFEREERSWIREAVLRAHTEKGLPIGGAAFAAVVGAHPQFPLNVAKVKRRHYGR